MPLRSETLPQKMLTGEELKEILKHQFAAMLDSDYAFSKTAAYRRVGVTLTATLQLGQPKENHVVRSYTRKMADGIIEGEPPLRLQCKCGHLMGLHPGSGPCGHTDEGRHCLCVAYEEDQDSAVVGLEREVNIDNPNLARIHHDLPVRFQERGEMKPMPFGAPLPGEPVPEFMNDPYPQMVTRELYYDKTQMPPMAESVQKDVSTREAQRLGVKQRSTEMGLKERAKE